jgi:hypothetical protein
MKICKCCKCGQEFEMPDNFFETILCESCDPFMQEEKKDEYKFENGTKYVDKK